MSVYGFSENKCRVPVVKQSEFEQFKEDITANSAKVTDGTTTVTVNGGFLIGKIMNPDNLWTDNHLLYMDTSGAMYRMTYKTESNTTATVNRITKLH